ncbi:MAG: thioesterase family protein [bacterium]
MPASVASIKPGLSANQSIIVKDEHTAPHVGSGAVSVLATPILVNLFEAAALASIEHQLPKGYQSLGTNLAIEHFAATPVGMRVEVVAKVTKVDGRAISFELSAKDEVEKIGGGTHQRVVVSLERFEKKVQLKGA